MKFIVTPEIFEKLPDLYVGVVVAKEVDNSQDYPKINELLNKYMNFSQEKFDGVNVKENEEIIPYREAFRKIDINPNRYPCSAEALFKRLSKGKDLPHINPLVDLNNAISLKYTLPMGTHSLDGIEDNIMMRVAQPGDNFIPLGTNKIEEPDEGEVVYAVGKDVRTRRWTWLQSEHGKITDQTRDVFFPIDGFTDVNKDTVNKARTDLAIRVAEIFGVKTQVGYVDRNHPEFDWE
ncbi:phenylalanine--tRNA ligase beta subunit-related protein [Lactobacillus johnsonii]|uniref:B3/B4 domain-containing protein n=1 Tax=Lactobacillus johnsonii TaxID=33959 RepID=UPI0028E69276|nr:phenylalanine--tRNA ligase beta subunit-related protein [Lactobacillus johnsonii]MDT9606023.1 phenylalanine--tRNA ligase beta subunit-related protein [Lactobacillus johnsonii]